MKFAEIIDRLDNGELCFREAWNNKFIVKQIPQTVPAEVVPRMSSLPEAAKRSLADAGDGSISYHDQVLIVEFGGRTTATSYVPSWEDIFSADWKIG